MSVELSRNGRLMGGPKGFWGSFKERPSAVSETPEYASRFGRRPLVVANHLGMLIVLSAAASLALACGPSFDLNQYPTPEMLFDATMREYEEGDCGAAEIGLQRLSFILPTRDPRRAQVRFYLAECLFRGHRYLEATREYRRVSDQWSQDSLAPLALLRAGEAYARLWPRAELDATYGLSAMTVFTELLNRYPSSDAATEAQQRIADLNEDFAVKEYKAGMYYFRLGGYDSAIIYFRSVVVNWPQSSSAPEALLKLIESFERIGYEEDMRDMCAQLQRFYPDEVPRAEACVDDTSSTAGYR
jgi:outer membrane assembly lipoprotein YfiO